MAAFSADDLILIIIALFLPPVTAVITDGCGGQLCLNVLLTILGFIPGLIHAIWLVFRRAERRDLNGGYAGNNRPIYVQQPHGHHQQQQVYQAPPPEGQTAYAPPPQQYGKMR